MTLHKQTFIILAIQFVHVLSFHWKRASQTINCKNDATNEKPRDVSYMLYVSKYAKSNFLSNTVQ